MKVLMIFFVIDEWLFFEFFKKFCHFCSEQVVICQIYPRRFWWITRGGIIHLHFFPEKCKIMTLYMVKKGGGRSLDSVNRGLKWLSRVGSRRLWTRTSIRLDREWLEFKGIFKFEFYQVCPSLLGSLMEVSYSGGCSAQMTPGPSHSHGYHGWPPALSVRDAVAFLPQIPDSARVLIFSDEPNFCQIKIFLQNPK